MVTLTTDFGLRDPYVAEMKAVILGIAPAAVLVDLTHDVAPHDVAEAALALEAAVPYFPRGTIHVAVVDPGVGTARRGIALAWNGHVLVGPDNGLFTPFVGRAGARAFELRAPGFRLPIVSRTFHGRDVFAPAAARLACGLPPSRLGPRVADPVTLAWAPPRPTAQGLVGRVVHVDRFGNLVTSIHAADLGARAGRLTVRIGRARLPIVGTYGDLCRGAAGAMVGSNDRLEVAVREGSAAARFRARRGTRVVVAAGRARS